VNKDHGVVVRLRTEKHLALSLKSDYLSYVCFASHSSTLLSTSISQNKQLEEMHKIVARIN
jgi:hypothetical protein